MEIAELNRRILESLKRGDRVRTMTLRSLVSAVRYAAIAKYKADWESHITASDIGDVVSKQIKTHKESIDMFAKAGRQDLVDKENAELAILSEFMPVQMPEQELRIIIDAALSTGETNFGKLMGMVMAKTAGKADGSRVSQLLKIIMK